MQFDAGSSCLELKVRISVCDSWGAMKILSKMFYAIVRQWAANTGKFQFYICTWPFINQ